MKLYIDKDMIGEIIMPLNENQKIPPQFMDNVIPITNAMDAGKFLRVQSDGKIGLETLIIAEEAEF